MKFYNQKLLKYRKRERLSCSKLCEIIGIGRTTYWKWESGSAIPEENFIRLLAKALNVSVSELSDLEPEQPISEINYSETIKSWLSFLDVEFESFQQKSINDALQKILSLNQELLKASVVIRALLKATTSIIYVKDKELKYMTANDAFLKNASLNSGFKVLNMTDEDFFTLSEAKLNHDEDRRVLQTGIPVTGAERHIPGSRRKKWGYISKQPIFDNNNKISGIIGSFTDITKLKELEGKRMILENAVNNLDSYIWIAKYNPETDKKVQVVYLSKSIINLYKKITHSTSIPSGISINNEICKEFNSEHYEYIRTLILSQKGIFPLNREFMEFSRSHNKKRFFYERIVNYEQHYYFGILEDITDQKNTEKNLKLLDISIDSMTDGVGMKTMLASVLLFVVAFGVFGAENFLYVKNKAMYSNLNLSCISKDQGVEVKIINSEIGPGETGLVKIKVNGEGKNIKLKLKADNIDQELELKTEKGYFNTYGFVFTDDYSDDNILGDVKEDYIYQMASIEV